jgi:hypothetical protein
MVDHGRTGFLANSPAEFSRLAGELATNENLRLAVAERARRHLVSRLANPDDNWRRWRQLLDCVFGQRC